MLYKIELTPEHVTIEEAARALSLDVEELDRSYGPVKIGDSLYAVRSKRSAPSPSDAAAPKLRREYADPVVRPFA
jgi:hypothetical protein